MGRTQIGGKAFVSSTLPWCLDKTVLAADTHRRIRSYKFEEQLDFDMLVWKLQHSASFSLIFFNFWHGCFDSIPLKLEICNWERRYQCDTVRELENVTQGMLYIAVLSWHFTFSQCMKFNCMVYCGTASCCVTYCIRSCLSQGISCWCGDL